MMSKLLTKGFQYGKVSKEKVEHGLVLVQNHSILDTTNVCTSDLSSQWVTKLWFNISPTQLIFGNVVEVSSDGGRHIVPTPGLLASRSGNLLRKWFYSTPAFSQKLFSYNF